MPDVNDKNNLQAALAVEVLTDIISEADENAKSGDARLALQGRQTSFLARVVLNLIGAVSPDTFTNATPPVAGQVQDTPGQPVAAETPPPPATVPGPGDTVSPNPAPVADTGSQPAPDTVPAPGSDVVTTPGSDTSGIGVGDTSGAAPADTASGNDGAAPASDTATTI